MHYTIYAAAAFPDPINKCLWFEYVLRNARSICIFSALRINN